MVNLQVIGGSDEVKQKLCAGVSALGDDITEESVSRVMREHNVSGNAILDTEQLTIQVEHEEHRDRRKVLKEKLNDKIEERRHFNSPEWRMYRSFGNRVPSPPDVRRRRKEYEPLLGTANNQFTQYLSLCLS